MPPYGSVPTGNPILAHMQAKIAGHYQFQLYPKLWDSSELSSYYSGKKWNIIKFTATVPDLPKSSAIYMFVVSPYCGGLKDHSYIFYVGKTNNVKKRYAGYLIEKSGRGSNPREAVVRFLNEFEGFIDFHYTLVPEQDLSKAEDLLKDNLTPVANTQLKLKGKLT